SPPNPASPISSSLRGSRPTDPADLASYRIHGVTLVMPQNSTRNPMKLFASAALSLTFISAAAGAQVNAGEQKPEAALPFTMTQVATFNLPWRIAFLPDGRMLITEKVGPLWVVTQQGAKTEVKNVPAVLHHDQGGMLGVYLSPNYKTDHNIYLTYSETHD